MQQRDVNDLDYRLRKLEEQSARFAEREEHTHEELSSISMLVHNVSVSIRSLELESARLRGVIGAVTWFMPLVTAVVGAVVGAGVAWFLRVV